MKFIYLSILLAFTSCKTAKNVQQNVSETWTLYDYKEVGQNILPLTYATYQLDKELFAKQLIEGLIQLPQADKSLAYYNVENSKTMSDALQQKYPQLKSYKGIQQNNSLCQCRIDQNDSTFKITILCNDATYYISDLHENNIYFFYNKQDLPKGVGHINE